MIKDFNIGDLVQCTSDDVFLKGIVGIITKISEKGITEGYHSSYCALEVLDEFGKIHWFKETIIKKVDI